MDHPTSLSGKHAAWRSAFRGVTRGLKTLARVAQLAPGAQAAFERTHALDPLGPQQERHPGARGFVRSRAEQDDVAIARDPLVLVDEVVPRDAQGTGDRLGLGLEVE